jgi:dCMP deaminase
LKQKHIDMFMEIAEVVASKSTARKLQVGAVAVRDQRIVSIGYNGTPPGMDNNCENQCEDGSLMTRPEVIHAEMNAIYKMARDGESGKGADLFVTHMPCFECAKAILSVGFNNVYYRKAYRNSDGINLLMNNGIATLQI